MLLAVQKFGGIVPKILDPILLAENKAQTAQNCRFDQGGVKPLFSDLVLGISLPLARSMFVYYEPVGIPNILVWTGDVDVVKTPIPNDQYNRLYYTENGLLKATANDLFYAVEGAPYPNLAHGPYHGTPGAFYYPCPPAPNSKMIVTMPPALTPVGNLAIDGTKATSFEYDSSRNTGGENTPDKAIQAIPAPSTFFLTKLSFQQLRENGHAWWQYDLGENNTQAINSLDMWYDDAQTFIPSQRPDGNVGPGDFTIIGSNDETFPTGNDVNGKPLTNILHQASGLGTGAGSQWNGGFTKLSWTWTNTTAYRYIRVLVTNVNVNHLYAPSHKLQINAIQFTHLDPTPDATLAQTKVFTYTLVNSYGQEGPPWVPSDTKDQTIENFYEGTTITISMPNATVNAKTGLAWDPLYKLDKKRVYISNETTSGETQLQLYGEYPVTQDNDTGPLYSASLGLVCPSTEWSQPPGFENGIPMGDTGSNPGLHGLISLPNGVIAGFSGNLLCMSVPKFPHAWPVYQQYPVDSDIVALGAYGTTVVALTKGQPYLAVGNDPANIVMEKIDSALSCLSKRGVVDIGGETVYPCPEGLMVIGPQRSDVLTRDDMTREQWIARYSPNNASFHAHYWQGKYVGFFGSAGFIFDLRTKDLIDLSSVAGCGYHDPATGRLNLGVDSGANSVGRAFDEGTTYRPAVYKSKRYKFPKTSFSAIKVLSSGYPVTVRIIYPGLPFTQALTVISEKPQRVPNKVLMDTVEVEWSTAEGGSLFDVSAIFLATGIEELPV